MTSLAAICWGDQRSASSRSTSARNRGQLTNLATFGRRARRWARSWACQAGKLGVATRSELAH